MVIARMCDANRIPNSQYYIPTMVCDGIRIPNIRLISIVKTPDYISYSSFPLWLILDCL